MPPLNDQTESGFSFWSEQSNGRSSFSLRPNQAQKLDWRQRPATQFSDEVDVHHVMARSDYTDEEVQASWFTASEYNEFRKDVAVTVYLVGNRPEALDDKLYTTRGAECRIEAILARRHEWKREARSAVLGEQQFQRESYETNEERLAAVYCQSSQAAVFDALDLAARDQADAEAYQKQPGEFDFFSDDWISSVSSCSDSSPEHTYQPRYKEPCSWDESGFDDAWLRDLAGPSVFSS